MKFYSIELFSNKSPIPDNTEFPKLKPLIDSYEFPKHILKDNYMETIHKEYPMYGWDKNSGYGTKLHHSAICNHGISIYHRKSYGICKKYA